MITSKCLMDFPLNLACSLIFVTVTKTVFGNSIDTSFPIVIHDNGKQLQRGSQQNAGKSAGDIPNHNYFGYSLAFLKGFQSDPLYSSLKGDDRSTIFIGAPNETRYTSNSGVVWKCEFNGNGKASLRCSIISQISEWFSTSHRYYDCENEDYSETQTQQWIGATLNVHPTSRELLACAPRWKLNDYNGCTGEEKMPGACYLASSTTTSLLNPLNRRPNVESVWINNNWLTFPLYRFAQFGFSSHFADSGELIVGAPSTRLWTGALIEVNQLRQESDSLTINNDFHDIRIASLHGYSVTSGRTRSGGSYYASGAPRARRLYGAVTITYPSNRGVHAIFEGERFGSYFGYALATLDLNGDVYDELLVGAPFYTPEVKSGHSMTSYNTGCVFIFNLARLQYERTIRPFKLCVDSQRVSGGSRFGSAITKIGDINYDYYEDFAISAPYNDNGQGTVFIYHGGFPYSTQPAQVIRGKSLNIEKLRGFGTYLLGGREVDIDGNGTPDLVIGAFESRHVVILRARPVAKVNIRIGFFMKNSNGHATQIMRFTPTQRNLIVRTCVKFWFSTTRVPLEQEIDAWLSFELGSKTKQVKFDEPVDEQLYKLSAYWRNWTCVDKRLIVVNQEEVDSGSSSSTIQVRARLKYNQTETSETQLVQHGKVTLSPSSRNQQFWKNYTKAYNAFDPYLPVPIPPVHSEWVQLSVAADNCEDDGDPECNTELKLQVKLLVEMKGATQDRKKLRKGKPLTIGNFDSLVVQIDLSNHNGTRTETAYNPELHIRLGVSKTFNMEPNLLDIVWELSGKLGRCKNLDDTSEDTKLEGSTALLGQICAQVVHPGRRIEYRVKIGNWGHLRVGNSSNAGLLILEVEAFPQQTRNQSVQHRMEVPLRADVNINVKSSVPQDQVEIDPGLARSGLVDISQFYLITNNGSSGTTMEAVTAEILVPTHAYLNGKNLTEVIGVADPSSLNIRCRSDVVKFFVLPANGQQNSSFPAENIVSENTGNRSKRSTKSTDVVPEKVTVKKSNDKFITLSGCEENTQKSGCRKIVCKMDLLPRTTAPKEIKLQMYILKNALGELVTLDTRGIRVNSVISVYYHGEKVIEQKGVTQRNFSVLKGIDALYLLGAGAGGSLLLILIVFLLYKCGFFRRKTKEDLKQLKRQTMLMDQNAFKQAQEGLQALMESEMHAEVAL